MSGAGEFSGTITAGGYRLVRALDGGGRVHEARHDRLAGRFALKLFGDVDARAFQRAVQQASALHHPGIARVVDYGGAPGAGAFVVMEWADGRSLASLLAEGGPLAPDAVARVVSSVALGLQAAHRHGVAHGHLSPERILVSGAGAANDDETPGAEHTKILGFGLGPTGALDPGASITEVTPYTAPEQATSDASPRADQFALAAVAYELLSGEAPTGDAEADRPPRSLREYDPTINVVIDDVVQRGLSFDADARWADVHTFAARLREAVDAEGTLEEKTRLAPLPLTVTKPAAATPTPIELGPVIASVDVDLRTPAPKRRELPFRDLPQPKLPVQGEISMNPPPARPHAFHDPSQLMPGQFPASRPSTRASAQPHYGIRPTPTFSFSDELESELHRRRKRRSGGGFGLLLVVLAAGVGGYLAVQTHVWQQAEPLVARGKELLRSLRTLAPGASPEPAPLPPSASAPAATAAPAASPTAPPAATTAATAPTPAPPEVVPIASAPPPRSAARAAASHASRPHHAHASAPRSGRAEHASRGRSSRALSDEAATEEALLAPP
jgi:serine/threonine protein kinase